MQALITVVIVSLALGFNCGHSNAQSSIGWLSSLHMFDAVTGWAIEAEGDSGVVAKGAVQSVVHTTDGGLHWKDVTPLIPPKQRLTGLFLQARWLTPLVAWVEAPLDDPVRKPVLFHTVDGGHTWRRAAIPAFGPFYFVDAKNGWTLAGNDVYRSTDSGQTWAKIGHAGFPDSQTTMTFLDTVSGWVIPGSASKSEWTLYVTRDGGHSWQRQQLPLPAYTKPEGAVLRSLVFFAARDGILPVSTSDSRLVACITHDGGITWTHAAPVTVTKWGPLSFADINHGWVADGSVLHMTTDGGHQWTTIRPGPPFIDVTLGDLDFISPRVGWAAGQPLYSPFLLKTVDGGHVWTTVQYRVLRR